MPQLSLYLRRNGLYRLEQGLRIGRRHREIGTRRDSEQSIEFFRTAVRGVLKATHEWESLSGSLAVQTDAQEFKVFADSVLHRIEQLLRERDRLLQLLAVAPGGISAGVTPRFVLVNTGVNEPR